jgi:hypothetical protein
MGRLLVANSKRASASAWLLWLSLVLVCWLSQVAGALALGAYFSGCFVFVFVFVVSA